jgi:acyl-CoA reductase-like NAD-dependent aldehyde dehydrogenase
MQEEIFGPILPVIFYDDKEEFYDVYTQNTNPLAFYIFSKRESFVDFFVQNFSAGGVLVNDTLMHLGHEELPFGGVGTSGIGNYHGFSSFACFSHTKSVMKQKYWFDAFYRYPKYTPKRLRFLRKIMKWVS